MERCCLAWRFCCAVRQACHAELKAQAIPQFLLQNSARFFFQEFSEKSRFRNFQKIPISSVSNFPKF